MFKMIFKLIGLVFIIGVLAAIAIPRIAETNTAKTETFSNKTKKEIHKDRQISDNEKKQILKLVKDEGRVKDAIWMDSGFLYVGMYDDKTNRNGFAEYLCLKIQDKVKLKNKLFIKIVDYKNVLQNKGFREIGNAICNADLKGRIEHY